VSNLSAEGYEEIKAFFEGLGVLLRVEEQGRAYPMSGKAASVRDALVFALENALPKPRALSIVRAPSTATVDIRTNTRVSAVEKTDAGAFAVTGESGETYEAPRVLIATGGKAGPAYGSLGDGYAFARALGHSVETIRPSLVPLVYAEERRETLSALKGVRARVRAELEVGGRRAAAADGEAQFTEDALSGIVTFDLSAAMPKTMIEGRPRVVAVLDLVPGTEEDALYEMMRRHEGFWLEGVLDKKLSDFIVAQAAEGAFEREDICAAAAAIAKRFVVPVSGTKGWKEAQATRGGVPPAEIYEETGESRRCPGLFFAGEMLDEDFLCGGYNLSYAWTTGIRAGANL
jgi:predicted Rossmann fold flavoprotein